MLEQKLWEPLYQPGLIDVTRGMHGLPKYALTFALRTGIHFDGFGNRLLGESRAMTPLDIIFLSFTILGGLALFIFGMNVMSDGLQLAAGSQLRTVLSSTTRNRIAGVTLGTILGFVTHSGPAVVMLVSFLNAGLMSLAESIPPMMGANIGTSLSMQLISFQLGKYCYIAIGIGLLVQISVPHTPTRNLGRALLGFGLLFLGMNTISQAIEPHRAIIAPVLSRVHGNTMQGMLTGIVLSTLITTLVQSSGATIGTCFALCSAGIFTSIEQVYPIVLGAHIGTCSTALLGAIGTNIDARRAAVSHLVFNVIGVLLAVAAAPLFIRALQFSSTDLVHQTANLHTSVMLVTTLLILPVTPWFARLITRLVPSQKPAPQPSFLDPQLTEYPEKAIYAAIAELQRVTKICARSFRLSIDILFQARRQEVQQVKLNENIVDEIKKAMKDYLGKLTLRHLSRRQAIMIQHLNRCMSDIERIGDHIDEVCDISIRRRKNAQARFNRDSLELLFSLYEAADRVLHLVIQSLNPDNQDFQGMAQSILLARDDYVEKSINAKSIFTERIANHELPPIVGMFFSEYASAFDRIVKHAKTVALAEKQPYFWIKRKKLDRMEEKAPAYTPPPLTDAHDFLDRLHSEEYL